MHVLLSEKPEENFPSIRRIKNRTEFGLVFKANRFVNERFIIYARENNRGFSRLGMVVSKKIIPKAVARNFSKRFVRELFRRKFPMKLSLDIVVRPRRQIDPASSMECCQALTQLFMAAQK